MSEDARSIDAIIEDMTDEDSFSYVTEQSDFFNEADIKAVCFEQRCVIKTKIGLHRDCLTWDAVTLKLAKKQNSFAVCPIPVYNDKQLVKARALL